MSVNGIPEHFVEKLFNQVKESNDKNTESIDRLTENISKFADVMKEISSHEIPNLKEKCDSIINISTAVKQENINLKNLLLKYNSSFEKIKEFEMESFIEDNREKLKILRWLSLKFKIVIAIIALFFVISSGSYITIRYLSHNKNVEIIEIMRKENSKLLNKVINENNKMKEEIITENNKIREEIKQENKDFESRVIKKIKIYYPNFNLKSGKRNK